MTCREAICVACGNPMPQRAHGHTCQACADGLDDEHFASGAIRESVDGTPCGDRHPAGPPLVASTFPADAAESNPPSKFDSSYRSASSSHLPGLYSLHIYPAEMTELGTAIERQILELMVRYQIFKRRGTMANAVLSLDAAKALGAFYRRTFIERRYEVL